MRFRLRSVPSTLGDEGKTSTKDEHGSNEKHPYSLVKWVDHVQNVSPGIESSI